MLSYEARKLIGYCLTFECSDGSGEIAIDFQGRNSTRSDVFGRMPGRNASP